MSAAVPIEGSGRFHCCAAAVNVPYQTITAMCHGSVKKIVHTAQSIRFARLAGAKLNFLPNGFTRLGPTNSSAGALAAIGIEARIVIPTMIPSACVTVRDTVF